jgi:hypothetical protein
MLVAGTEVAANAVAGYIAPREGTGTGLWVVRQLTWRVECFDSPRGFTVRVCL